RRDLRTRRDHRPQAPPWSSPQGRAQGAGGMTRIRTTDTPGFTQLMTDLTGSSSRTRRSTEMQTMHEALAREHMRQLQHDARRQSLSSKVASANRWRYVERRA